VYNPDVPNKITSGSYVEERDINTGNIRVFESPKLAAHAIDVSRKTFEDFVDRGMSLGGKVYRTLDPTEYNIWADPEDVPPSEVFVVPALSSTPRTGPVIARNLATGQDTPFVNSKVAARHFKVDMENLLNTFVDKPRQIYGHAIRRATSNRVWVPPNNLRYDSFCVNTGTYVVAMDPVTKEVTDMFENIKSAAEKALAVFGKRVPQSTLGQSVKDGKLRVGRLWRKAEEHEYAMFQDIEAST
jgi:hypothetical protein